MKSALTALVALALPVALYAQAPAPQSDPMTTSFRNRITNLHRNLAQAFDSIPASKFGYKPTPAQQSIGYIAQHLASDSYFFCSNFGDMKPSLPASDTQTADTVKANWPKDSLVAKMKASFTFCQNAFAQLTDAKLAETYMVTQGNNSRQVLRMNSVFGHAMDLQDHYSQIANYMRLNGMLPPTALPRNNR